MNDVFDGNSNSTYKYQVKSSPPGHVYAFNYIFSGQARVREGAQYDSLNLRDTFSKLDYKVFIYEDLNKKQTLEKIEAIRTDQNLRTVDSIIFFFLSHGETPYEFLSVDHETLHLHDIRRQFTRRKCPQLEAKPKIFMSNFCRGPKFEKQVFNDEGEVLKDIVTIHATAEGIRALRLRDTGTIFVTSLCEVLNKMYIFMDLRQIYAKLQGIMTAKGGSSPMWEDYAFKKFYFRRSNYKRNCQQTPEI
ncbi:caspase-2-like [Homarus americanus]|uniref:caspase-2-like n=1 Tax=Homarus americanus TaxID=6706 RepID=UPI001C43C8D0|nr:caspase-2-like [Homarus americanus]